VRIAASPSTRIALGAEARRRAHRFSNAVSNHALAELYDELLGGARAQNVAA
jgi:hypothetical protein